ncbi:PBP1A family penicillin-binding protein [Limibaculum sp. FT325]|uniref:transglycosylase domain-containing protein n=1 Tax=Thermohalobaculum sediminis TaxID=2939436 RepID=UPI0020C02141|nr:PBP1A family penicillin-binding protein [Limibaculum sediminis]MCL5776668.1 PBP1A family penicillin-binding protein [Limibaculum sediminis]
MAQRGMGKDGHEPNRRKGRKSRHPDGADPGPVGRAVRFVVLGTAGLVWRILWRVGLVGAAVLALATGYYYSQLPAPGVLFDGRGGGSVTMLDRHGNVFAWRGEQYGGELRATEVSPHLIHAVVSAEDRRFWDHPGVDVRGLARAMLVNLRAGRVVQGGSTLTQQVAKNVFLTAERSIERKLKEVPMALALELKYDKEDILSIYLNRVYLGAGTFGFEAASQRYFGKSARLLSSAEAAMLAGLLRAPSRYAPTSDLERAQGRASVIIRLMEEEGYLTQAQVTEALASPAELSAAAAARAGGYFADWVMETAPGFLAKDTTEDVTMATTFDPEIQRKAEAALARVFAEKVKEGSTAQAAIVVMSRDGAVRAIVGGREQGTGQFNRASQALRQTGSAFKPVVYAAALEAGWSPNDIVEDAPLTIGNWSPSNYDNRFRGPITLTDALANSINTVAVRVSEQVGRERVAAMATRLGITSPIAPGPAVALGTSEATLVDMTGVYATIANAGGSAAPYGIREIRLRGEDLPLMRGDAAVGEQVIAPRSAALLTYMMREVIEAGTGRRARLPGREAAGKTGTTQAARDAWFIGFTADYVTGVWMGNDDNTPLTGVTGGGLPAEIWREAMLAIHEGIEPKPLRLESPGPGSLLMAGGASSLGGADTVVERVFNDVLRGLLGGGGGGDTRRGGDFRPNTSDR